jgi:hypothetical protein
MTLLDADEKQRDPLLGEDTFELLAAVEDSFGVEFRDYQALLGMTVRELADYICKEANYPTAEKCLSAVTFYRLRQAFRVLFEIPRTAIRPATSVADLLPWGSRKTQWRMLQAHLGLTLPSLNYPSWFACVALVVPATFLISLKALLGIRLNAIEIVGGSLVLFLASLVAFIPLARTLPSDCETIGGFTKVVLAHNYATFAYQYGRSSESDVVLALRQLIATEMGRGLEEISAETHIPGDLNIY